MKKSLSILLLTVCGYSFSQMGIGTLDPDPRSVLELKSTPGKGRGLLIPRMSSTERLGMEVGSDDIGTPLSIGQLSMLVFDNTRNLFYSFNNTVPTVNIPFDYRAAGTDAETFKNWQILNPWKTQYAWDGSKPHINLIQDTAATGYVGIGWVDYTESPTFPLHVKGDGYFENSNLTVDQNITSRSVTADTIGVDTSFLQGYGSVPVGTVLMWSGVWDDIVEGVLKDKGWLLCDSKNNGDPLLEYTDLRGNKRPIPNLSGRFIVGYDSDMGATGDPDYNAISNVGPVDPNDPTNYGTVNGVERNKFYELEEGGKRVKLLEPAMPQHNHNANNLMHNHEINLPLVKEDRVTGTTLNRCPVRIQHTQNADGIHSRVTKTIGQNYSLSCPSTGRYRDWTQIGYENNGFLTFNSENTALSLDTQGGLVWPLTSPKFGNPDETAMPIENRPPYYVLAYIIRVK